VSPEALDIAKRQLLLRFKDADGEFSEAWNTMAAIRLLLDVDAK